MISNLMSKLTAINSTLLKDNNHIFYFNMQNTFKYNSLKNKLADLLNSYFKHFDCLISEPSITITPLKLNIHLFYYTKAISKKNQKIINQRYKQIY